MGGGGGEGYYRDGGMGIIGMGGGALQGWESGNSREYFREGIL